MIDWMNSSSYYLTLGIGIGIVFMAVLELLLFITRKSDEEDI